MHLYRNRRLFSSLPSSYARWYNSAPKHLLAPSAGKQHGCSCQFASLQLLQGNSPSTVCSLTLWENLMAAFYFFFFKSVVGFWSWTPRRWLCSRNGYVLIWAEISSGNASQKEPAYWLSGKARHFLLLKHYFLNFHFNQLLPPGKPPALEPDWEESCSFFANSG